MQICEEQQQLIKQVAEDIFEHSRKLSLTATSEKNRNQFCKKLKLTLGSVALTLHEFSKVEQDIGIARKELKNAYCILTQPQGEPVYIEQFNGHEKKLVKYEFRIAINKGWGLNCRIEMIDLIETCESPQKLAALIANSCLIEFSNYLSRI